MCHGLLGPHQPGWWREMSWAARSARASGKRQEIKGAWAPSCVVDLGSRGRHRPPSSNYVHLYPTNATFIQQTPPPSNYRHLHLTIPPPSNKRHHRPPSSNYVHLYPTNATFIQLSPPSSNYSTSIQQTPPSVTIIQLCTPLSN